jgi:hypothetical protein
MGELFVASLTMTTKERILKELDQIPESQFESILAYLQRLSAPTQDQIDDAFLKAYERSVEERKEVYQRLADS